MRVLIASADSAAARVVREIAQNDGHEVQHVASGARALELLLSPTPPELLVVEVDLPDLDGIELCRQLDAATTQAPVYVLAVGAESSRQQALDALAAGADDFVARPLAPDLLRARLRAAERIVAASSPRSDLVLLALEEAGRSEGGEVVVRSNGAVGKVFVHRGRIAWAHISGDTDLLLERLASEHGLSKEDAAAVLEECRATGKHFASVLVEWGLIEEAALREAVRRWLASKLRAMLALERPSVLFVPQTRSYSGAGFTFSVSELGADFSESSAPPASMQRARSVPPPNTDAAWERAFVCDDDERAPRVSALLAEALGLEGAVGVTLLDRHSGASLGRRGDGVHPDVAWAALDALNVLSAQEQVQDLIVRGKDRSHVAVMVPRHPALFLYLVVDNAIASAASARMGLRGLGDRVADALEQPLPRVQRAAG